MARDITERMEEMVADEAIMEAKFPVAQEQTPDSAMEAEQDISVAEDVLGPSQVAPVNDPEVVQVAGLADIATGTSKWVGERVKKAEANLAVNAVKDEPVQKVGSALVIRAASDEEVEALAEAVGGEYTKGLNFPAIAEGLEEFDMAAHMARMKDANQDLFERQRRGAMTFEQIKAVADKFDLGDVVADFATRNAGDSSNAEELLAGIMTSVQMFTETRRLWAEIADMPAGEARDAAVRRAATMQTLTANVMSNVSGATSEAARATAIAGEAQRRLGVDFAAQSAEMRNLFGAETVEDMEYMGQLFMSLPTPASKSNFIKNGFNKTMDVIIEVWINSILNAPTTHMVNILGNAAFMATRIVEQVPAATFGAIRTMRPGSNPDRARYRDVITTFQGLRAGFTDALVLSGKSFVTEEASDLASKIDVRNRRAIGTTGDPRVIIDEVRQGNVVAAATNVLGVSARMGGRFLLAEDEFFKGVGYRMELHRIVGTRTANYYDELVAAGKTPEEAQLRAAAEGARLLNRPPEGLVKDAKEAARVMTFQGDLPGWLGDLQGSMSHPIVKLFVPFFKTPTNVMKETLSRTPLALAHPNTIRALKNGGREADIALGKISTGSLIMGTFATMAMGDDPDLIIMGSGPADPKARQAMFREGIQPFSVNFRNEDGTFTSFTYSRLDPISGMLAMAADFAYYAQYEEDASMIDRLAMSMTMGLSEYAMDMPFLQGVQEMAGVMTTPNPVIRSDLMLEMIGRKMTGAGLAFVPGVSSFGAAVERTFVDPAQSNTMLPEVGLIGEDPTELPAFMRGFYIELQRAKARNPFFSDTVPPKLNLWGEVMTVGSGSPGYDFWSPIMIKETKYAPVDRELQDLGYGLAMPNKRLGGVILNAKQYNKWITTMNNLDARGRLPGDPDWDVSTTLLPALAGMIADPLYSQLPTREDKMDKLSTRLGVYKKAAKTLLLAGDPDLALKVLAVQ